MVQVLELLKGSDNPAEDQATLFRTQIIFWLIGATDGHAKNFSVFLSPGGSYHLTPLYDVLTAQPSLDNGQIRKNQMRLAMSVGKKRHYRINEILGRHFIQTGEAAGLPKSLIKDTAQSVADTAEAALGKIESVLPKDFPEGIHTSVSNAVMQRLSALSVTQLA